ncbi:MAG: hypothetical protein ACJAZ2_001915 [Glaciecola sp.]|jgi:hypothetical protein
MTKFNSSGQIFNKYLIVFTCLLCCLNLNGQSKLTNNLSVNGNYQSGYALPEYSVFTLTTNDYIRSFELAFTKQTTGKTVWERAYNYPAYGLSLYYSNLGNNELLGKEFAAVYFMKLYILSRSKFKIFNISGIGGSYVSKIFNLNDNYLNVVVGSHLNFHFNMRFGASYELTDKLGVNTGISFDHNSNANMASPNVGVNTLTAYGGLSYKLGTHQELNDTIQDKHISKNIYYAFASVGGKHTQSLSSTYYLTSSLSFEAKRALTRAFHLGIGTDLFYDSAVHSELQKDNRDFKSSDNFQSGLHLSTTIVYNIFSLSLHQGVYLGLKEQVGKNTLYNKGVMQFKIHKNMSARIIMKSHLHILDYPEVGFGFQF